MPFHSLSACCPGRQAAAPKTVPQAPAAAFQLVSFSAITKLLVVLCPLAALALLATRFLASRAETYAPAYHRLTSFTFFGGSCCLWLVRMRQSLGFRMHRQ